MGITELLSESAHGIAAAVVAVGSVLAAHVIGRRSAVRPGAEMADVVSELGLPHRIARRRDERWEMWSYSARRHDRMVVTFEDGRVSSVRS